MNKWLAYLLLTGGAMLILRANGSSLSSLLGGLTGEPAGTDPGAPKGGGFAGQIGSNFTRVGSDLGTAIDALAGVAADATTWLDATLQTADGKAVISTTPKVFTWQLMVPRINGAGTTYFGGRIVRAATAPADTTGGSYWKRLD